MNLLFSYTGRIGRGSWWVSRLVIFAIIFAVLALAFVLQDENGNLQSDSTGLFVGLVGLAALPLIFWINVVTTIKRYHDRGKAGYWVLLIFVPYIGWLWQLVECGFLEGDEGFNEYGRPPNMKKRPAPKMDASDVVDAPVKEKPVKAKPRPFEYDLRPTIKTGRTREYSPTSPRKP